MTKKERNKKILFGITTGVLAGLLVVALTAGVYAQRILSNPTIYPMITVEGLEIHNLSQEEARELLEAHVAPRKVEQTLTLTYEDQEWTIPYKELGFYYYFEEALTQAMAYGRSGGYVDRLTEIFGLREQPVHLTLSYGFQEALLIAVIDDIAEELAVDSKAAEIRRGNNGFVVTPERIGRELDKETAHQLAWEALIAENQEPVSLETKEISLYPREVDLRQIETVISEFSTTFNAGDVGRTANLRLGSSSIDGILLLPGDEFSFNETTGPRIASAGYREAPVILRGELVPGIGGGICQVSTTLYNAVARADLGIVERTNHSLPVSYVPRGQDATVAFGSLDFRFVNDMDTPVFLESEVAGNRVIVRLYGKDAARPSIDLVSEVVQVVEPTIETRYDGNLYEGETVVEREAKTGYRVVTYKIFRENGQVVRREEFSRDYYRPVNGIIIRGTRPPAVQEWFISDPEEAAETSE